jgi:hypothetical protein
LEEIVEAPTRYAVAVDLGPAEGYAPTVYLSDKEGSIPSGMRRDLSEFIESRLSDAARLITPRRSRRTRRALAAFAAFKFEAGTQPNEALSLVHRVMSWFFQNLSDSLSRLEAETRKKRRLSRRKAHRRERYEIRRDLRRLSGSPHITT